MLKINELNNSKVFYNEKGKNAVTYKRVTKKSHYFEKQKEISSINNEFTLTPNHNQVIWHKQYQRLIQIAYYQAGKTVVQTLLPQHPPVSLIMLNPLGVTASTSADTYISSNPTFNTQCRSSLESRLIGFYGGKATSQLFEYEYERMLFFYNNKENPFVGTFKKGTHVSASQASRPKVWRSKTQDLCIPHLHSYIPPLLHTIEDGSTVRYASNTLHTQGKVWEEHLPSVWCCFTIPKVGDAYVATPKVSIPCASRTEGIQRYRETHVAPPVRSKKMVRSRQGSKTPKMIPSKMVRSIRETGVLLHSTIITPLASQHRSGGAPTFGMVVRGTGVASHTTLLASQTRRGGAPVPPSVVMVICGKVMHKVCWVIPSWMIRSICGMGGNTGKTLSNTSRKMVYRNGSNSEKRVRMVQQLDKSTLLEYFQKRSLSLWKRRAHMVVCSPHYFSSMGKENKTGFFQNKKTNFPNLINEYQNLITKLKNKRDVYNFSTTLVRVLSADAKTSFEKDTLSRLTSLGEHVITPSRTLCTTEEQQVIQKYAGGKEQAPQEFAIDTSFEGGASHVHTFDLATPLASPKVKQHLTLPTFGVATFGMQRSKKVLRSICDNSNWQNSVVTFDGKGIIQVIEGVAERNGFAKQKRGFYGTFQKTNTECSRSFAGAGNNFFQSNIGTIEIQTATRLANLVVNNWNFYSFNPGLVGEIEDAQYTKFFEQKQGTNVFPKSSYSSKRISIENVKTKQSSNVETLNLVNSFQFSNVQRDRFSLGWFRLYLPDIEATAFLKNAANYFFNLGLQTAVRPSISKLNPKLCSSACDFKFACVDQLSKESKTSNMFSLNNNKRPALLHFSTTELNKKNKNNSTQVIPILPFNSKVKIACFTWQKTKGNIPKYSQNVFSCLFEGKTTNNLRIGLGLLRSMAKRRNQTYHEPVKRLMNKSNIPHRISLTGDKVDKINIKHKQLAYLDVSSFLSQEKQIILKGSINETTFDHNFQTSFQHYYSTLPFKPKKSVRFKGCCYICIATIPSFASRATIFDGMQQRWYVKNKKQGNKPKKSGISSNYVNKVSNVEKELIFRTLINNSFTKAFLLINQNRQLLDYFVDYLIRFQILRQHQILYLFSAILLNCKKPK